MECVSISQCNDSLISVFLDACVLFPAIRNHDSDERTYITQIAPRLRLIASVTLYEVAFAHKGIALRTLRENQRWINDHDIKQVPFEEAVGKRFERFLKEDARHVRKRISLGDCLLACWANASPMRKVALATSNRRDFEHLPIPLVQEFLPAAS